MGISRGAQRVMRQRSRNPLAKTRAFGKTHLKKEIRTTTTAEPETLP